MVVPSLCHLLLLLPGLFPRAPTLRHRPLLLPRRALDLVRAGLWNSRNFLNVTILSRVTTTVTKVIPIVRGNLEKCSVPLLVQQLVKCLLFASPAHVGVDVVLGLHLGVGAVVHGLPRQLSDVALQPLALT